LHSVSDAVETFRLPFDLDHGRLAARTAHGHPRVRSAVNLAPCRVLASPVGFKADMFALQPP